MDKEAAPKYIRSNFRADDRLAVVLIQKSSGNVVQRLSSADQIASDEFQRWLRYMNREKHEIYVSMNALEPRARGRTKGDVAEVRHVSYCPNMDALAHRSSRSRSSPHRRPWNGTRLGKSSRSPTISQRSARRSSRNGSIIAYPLPVFKTSG